MSPLFLNRDVLLCIAESASVGPCGRWIQLAVMRLVCKQWASRIGTHCDMMRALRKDVEALPVCCVDTQTHCHVRVMTHPRRSIFSDVCERGFFCGNKIDWMILDQVHMLLPETDTGLHYARRIFYAMRRLPNFPFAWSAFPPLMLKYFQMEQRGGIDHDYVMSYVVPVGPPERRFYFGPAPRTLLDCGYMTKELGIDTIINMRPLTALVSGSGHNQAEAYLVHWNRAGEDIPTVVRSIATPNDPIENQSDARQIDFYVNSARKVVAYMREHPKAIVFIHQHDGTHHEAYVAFLVWYLLDKDSSPHAALQTWLEKEDYMQVLRDDVQIDLFGQMIKHLDKTSKSNALESWLKKRKVEK